MTERFAHQRQYARIALSGVTLDRFGGYGMIGLARRIGVANNGGYLLPTFQGDTAAAMFNCGKTRITRSLTEAQSKGQLADRHAGLFALSTQKRPALDPGLPELNGLGFGRRLM